MTKPRFIFLEFLPFEGKTSGMKKKLARPAKKVSKKPMPEMDGPELPRKKPARAHAPKLDVLGDRRGVAELDAGLRLALAQVARGEVRFVPFGKADDDLIDRMIGSD